VVRVVGDEGALVRDEGFGGGALGGGWVRVDVCVLDMFSCHLPPGEEGRNGLHGRDSWIVVMDGMVDRGVGLVWAVVVVLTVRG
jgi:hypothetical protein